VGNIDKTFIPESIDRCPECDSEKIVFLESRGRKRRVTFGVKIWGHPLAGRCQEAQTFL